LERGAPAPLSVRLKGRLSPRPESGTRRTTHSSRLGPSVTFQCRIYCAPEWRALANVLVGRVVLCPPHPELIACFPHQRTRQLVAAPVRARKVRLKPRCQMCLTEPARSGLRALPTLHFCGKPEVVGGTTFRVVHHVPQPVSGEEIGRKIFCGISTGVRQLRT